MSAMKRTIIMLVALLLLVTEGYGQGTPDEASAKSQEDVLTQDEASFQDRETDTATSGDKAPGFRKEAAEAKRKSVASAKKIGPAIKRAAVEVKNDFVAATKKVGPAIKKAASNVKEELKEITK